MKVRELLAFLQDYEPDAEVYLVTQKSWPFESDVTAARVREEVEPGVKREPFHEPTDVLIVEGRQVAYGTRKAWSDDFG